ncbi:hypothetical protein [Pseudomonas sp.]|uniref:hypothetical protein n=1 Tax=Pseudomonas sp. TaxID=306 RepID=UPI003569F879
MNAEDLPPLTRLAVSADFSLQADPDDDVQSDLVRTYRMKAMAQAGDGFDEADEVQVGSIHIQLFRFDVALNLGYDPEQVADDVSQDALTIYQALQEELGEMSSGMSQDCLMVSHFSFEEPYCGSAVELSALRTALIGLSTGISRAFLPLGVVIPDICSATAKTLNATTLYFDKIGFKPLKLGSDILWLDMELASFWNE